MIRTAMTAIALITSAALSAPAQSQLPQTSEARAAAVARELQRAIQVAGRPIETGTIEERMEAHGVPAVSVAVIHDGRVDWARAWGYADVEAQRRATPATLFQAASMSKSVAALAALTMVERGEISLDTDVNGTLRSWKVPTGASSAERPVTLRGLLSHTAGTTVHGFPGYAAGVPVPTTVQVLDAAGPTNTAAVRVDTLPGSLWRYSGGGYTVAQLLMSDVADTPYATLLRERVLAPLGMDASTSEQPLPEGMRERAATAYRSDGRAVEGLYHTYPEMAAAGLWTTPSDYARFVLAVQHALRGGSGAIVSQATARAMTTPVMNGYGLGVGVAGSGDALRFSHGGANAGFRSTFIGFISQDAGIVVMTNSDNGAALASEIVLAAARVYGWPAPTPTVVTPIVLAPAVLDTYAGTYQVTGTRLMVTRDGDRLMLSEDGARPLELVPTAPDTFMYLGAGIMLRFERDDAGAIVAIRAGSARAERVAR